MPRYDDIEVRKGEFMNPSTHELFDSNDNYLGREDYDSPHVQKLRKSNNSTNQQNSMISEGGAPENENFFMSVFFGFLYGIPIGGMITAFWYYIIGLEFNLERYGSFWNNAANVMIVCSIYLFFAFYKRTKFIEGILIIIFLGSPIGGFVLGFILTIGYCYYTKSSVHDVMGKFLFFSTIAIFVISVIIRFLYKIKNLK